ncbi:hypothetical protein [Citrobacter portucalensis]|uniref:hypothetical protein n=1 Tax=Citrobacter portucalensis TaxID=1639133 RepID=UPI00388D7F31
MFHLDNNSGVSAMPPVGAVQSSAPRWYTEGGGGTPASYPGADWYNIIQAELLNLLSAYGINPNKSDFNQLQHAIEEAISQNATANSALLTAIAALVTSANKMPYFTGKDKVAMTDLTAFARTLLGRSDAAGVLSDLGLTNFADKNSSNEQLFNGVVASKKGVSATSTDGNRRVNLFVSDTGYELIVYIDGKYNNAIQIPTKAGTMALLDDVSNSVQSAPPPIGIPFFWPVSAMPNTVVPEWSSNVFLKMNDATFSASTYPALARVWPGLKLTDCRGEFLRIWDDGRGVDGGRALLSAQSDAIRNITGNVGVYSDGLLTYASGAFSLGPSASNKNNPISGSGANAYATFDASKVVPTASENRPRNVAFNLLVRAK